MKIYTIVMRDEFNRTQIIGAFVSLKAAKAWLKKPTPVEVDKLDYSNNYVAYSLDALAFGPTEQDAIENLTKRVQKYCKVKKLEVVE